MALDFTSPLDLSLAPIAFGLETLANLLVLVLGTPEWSQPWGYSRSDYRAEEFCEYIIRWILDGNDKIIACFVLFCLVIAATHFIPSPYRQKAHLQSALTKSNLQYRGAEDKIRDLEHQNSSLKEEAHNDAMTSAKTITTLQSERTTLHSDNTNLKISLTAEQKARQNDAEKASDAAEQSDIWIKRQAENIETQKQDIGAQRQEIEALTQRAETAEQALREKDNPVNTEEQQRQKRRLELADERIEKLEHEAEERKSDLEALQNELETAESNEHDSKIKLETAEAEGQELQSKLDKTRTELSEVKEKLNKTANHASAKQKELTTANEMIRNQDVKYKALSDGNSATKKRCTEFEQEIKTIKSAKQQHEVNPKPMVEANKKLERQLHDATERIDKLGKKHSSDLTSLQAQLRISQSDVQRLNEEKRVAGIAHEKAMEKTHQAAANQTKKFQQEHQSKQKLLQDQLDKAQSFTSELQKKLKECQDSSKLTMELKDKKITSEQQKHQVALGAKNKEHNDAIHSKDARIETLEVCVREATERTAHHNETMAQVQAELETLQSDLELKSLTIRRLQFELEAASVEIQEVNNVMYLLERKTWHEYLKLQEAYILESYTIVEDNLRQAESYIQALQVTFDGLEEEHEVALEARDDAFAAQQRQYEEAARKADEDLKACHDHGKVLKSKIQQLEDSLTDRCEDGEALEGEESMLEGQRDITQLTLSAIHSAVESQRARMTERTSRELMERKDEPQSIGLDTALDVKLAIDEPGAEEPDEEGGQDAEEFDDDEEPGAAENDASDRVQYNNSDNVGKSTGASEQSTRKRGGRGRGARNTVRDLHVQPDTAREALRLMPQQTLGSTEPTVQQLDTAAVSRPQALRIAGPAQPPQQQVHGQNLPQHRASHSAEVIQLPQQQTPAQSLQPTQPAAADSPQPATITIRLPQPRVQGLSGSQHEHGQPFEPPQQQTYRLSGSRWESEPDPPFQPPQPRTRIPRGPNHPRRPRFRR